MFSEEHISFPPLAVILSTVSCCLSILGSYIIIWTYIWLPEIRNPARKLFTFLSFADSLTAIGILISAIASYMDKFNDVCLYQSYITTFSSLVSFNLTIAIAILLFSTVVYNFDGETKASLVVTINILCWLIPAIIVGLAGEFRVLGKQAVIETGYGNSSTAGTGPWCWINEDKPNHTMWMIVTGKGWEVVCYLLTTSLYVLLKVHLHLHYRFVGFGDIRSSIRDEDQNFLYVWFVLYVLRLWGTIRFVMKLTHCSEYSTTCDMLYNEVFLYMQAFGDPAQGFSNFIIFVLLDRTVRNKILQSCGEILSCSKKQESYNCSDDTSGYLISAIASYMDKFWDVCIYQSYITTFSSLVSFNLTIAIAILLFITVLYNFDGESNAKLVNVTNVLCWGIPAVITVIAGQCSVLGKQIIGSNFRNSSTVGTGPWCWIDRTDPNSTEWMFVTGKGWEILIYMLTTTLYVILKIHLHLHYRFVGFGNIRNSIRDEDQNFLYVWFVLYVLRLWGTIRFVMSFTDCQDHSYCDTLYGEVFVYMQAIGDPAQGWCNFILFVILDKTVRNRIVQLCVNTTTSHVLDDPDERTALHSSLSKRRPSSRTSLF